MKKYILPDFERSNLNISATLAEFLGAPNKNATLPVVREFLDRKYNLPVQNCLFPDTSFFVRAHTRGRSYYVTVPELQISLEIYCS